MSSRSGLMRKLVVATKITKNETTNNKGTCQTKKRKFCRNGPDTPVGARRTLRLGRTLRSVCVGHSGVGDAVRRFGGNSSPNSSNPWGNWQDWRLETQKDWEQSLKSRNPWIKTTRNAHNREIDPRPNLGLFMKFSEFWGKRDFVGRSLATKSC